MRRCRSGNTLKLYDPAIGAWSRVGPSDYANIDQVSARQYEYPRLHLLPDGSVISVSPMTNGRLERWHPYTDSGDWDDVTGPPPEGIYNNGFAQDTTSVLPPLVPQDKYRARIIQAGGSTPFILDTTNPAAGWTAATRSMFDNPATGDVNPVRENADSVILPTGEILIEGGLKVGSSDATGVTSPELFDPTTSARQVLPHSPVVRGYHSTALLMPNGAVWVASSNFNANPGLSNRELRIEIFEPWYFCGRRPTITDAPPRARHGDEVQILTPDAATVTRVVLVRAGTVTHNFNPDQRHVTLEFRRGEADSIIATVPNDPNLAIVGYHLLFVIDGTGRPSTGRFLQITPRTGGWSPGLQDEWWDRLRAVLADNRRPGPDNLRWITRDLAPTAPPPLRRPLATEPHGGGDQGGHVHGPTPPDHDHAHDHDHPDNDDDDGPHDDQGPGGGHHH